MGLLDQKFQIMYQIVSDRALDCASDDASDRVSSYASDDVASRASSRASGHASGHVSGRASGRASSHVSGRASVMYQRVSGCTSPEHEHSGTWVFRNMNVPELGSFRYIETQFPTGRHHRMQSSSPSSLVHLLSLYRPPISACQFNKNYKKILPPIPVLLQFISIL